MQVQGATLQGATLEASTVAKTVALLRQLNQLTVRTATTCQGLFDDCSSVQNRVAALAGRVKTAEAAAVDLECSRASGVRPIQELEYERASLPTTLRSQVAMSHVSTGLSNTNVP